MMGKGGLCGISGHIKAFGLSHSHTKENLHTLYSTVYMLRGSRLVIMMCTCFSIQVHSVVSPAFVW